MSIIKPFALTMASLNTPFRYGEVFVVLFNKRVTSKQQWWNHRWDNSWFRDNGFFETSQVVDFDDYDGDIEHCDIGFIDAVIHTWIGKVQIESFEALREDHAHVLVTAAAEDNIPVFINTLLAPKLSNEGNLHERISLFLEEDVIGAGIRLIYFDATSMIVEQIADLKHLQAIVKALDDSLELQVKAYLNFKLEIGFPGCFGELEIFERDARTYVYLYVDELDDEIVMRLKDDVIALKAEYDPSLLDTEMAGELEDTVTCHDLALKIGGSAKPEEKLRSFLIEEVLQNNIPIVFINSVLQTACQLTQTEEIFGLIDRYGDRLNIFIREYDDDDDEPDDDE